MQSVKYYKCDYCGEEFMSKEACKEHELSHMDTYGNLTNEQLANKIEELSSLALSHHLFNTVLGMPVGSFQNLVEEAANRLRGEFDE